MKGNRKQLEPPQFLSGWKEIANYLGKGVRTVQRYEWQMGLPVRRPAGKPRGSVVATKLELDAWVNASPIRKAFCLTRAPGDFTGSATTITQRLQEMSRLREQMAELRTELNAAIELLRDSVCCLQVELSKNRWKDIMYPMTVVEGEDRAQHMVDLLEADTRLGRAS